MPCPTHTQGHTAQTHTLQALSYVSRGLSKLNLNLRNTHVRISTFNLTYVGRVEIKAGTERKTELHYLTLPFLLHLLL